jgi:hypothetical protein
MHSFLTLIVPFEVCVQVHALAAAIVCGAEDTGVLGNLPAILPEVVQKEIFVGQIALTFQAVLQFLENLSRWSLAVVFQLAGIVRGGLPAVKFNDIHFPASLL